MSIFVNIILNYFINFGYGGIVFLMAVESSFVPFPSEVVIPPAAYLASQGEMNIFLVVLSGIGGSLLGATLNYFLAFYLGRIVVYKLAETKIAKMMLINQKKIKISEEYFLRYGNISTFIGRLLPVIRQLISLPAGFSKMKFGNFIFLTFLGSGIWVSILAALGYFFGANKELFQIYHKEAVIFFVSIFFLIITYFVAKRIKNIS